MYTRRQKVKYLTSQFNLDGKGLEIGPHVDPMFRRSQGINVRYVETRDGDTLRAFVKEQGGDPSIVEDIDYVLERGKTLAEHAPGETFDWVTSSHVIEHIPDFLGHLCAFRSIRPVIPTTSGHLNRGIRPLLARRVEA